MGWFVVVGAVLVLIALVSLVAGLLWLVSWRPSASPPQAPPLSLPAPDALGPASQAIGPGLASDGQVQQVQQLADELFRAVAERRFVDARLLLPAGRYGGKDVGERFGGGGRVLFAPVASWNLGRDRVEVRAVLVVQATERSEVACTRWAVDLAARKVTVVGEKVLGDTGADADPGVLARRVERDCRSRVLPERA
jgi:hypothetical protein